MRVGDSRRPLRYLSSPVHCARSCDISFSWRYSQPVHSSTSCIHCLLGLPWCRNPSMIPSRTVSANCPALPLVMWPKCCSFGFATLLQYSSIFNFTNQISNFVYYTSLFVRSYVQCSSEPHQSRLDSPPHPLVTCLSHHPRSHRISLHHSFTPGSNLPFQQILRTLDFFYLPDCIRDNGTGPDLPRLSLEASTLRRRQQNSI